MWLHEGVFAIHPNSLLCWDSKRGAGAMVDACPYLPVGQDMASHVSAPGVSVTDCVAPLPLLGVPHGVGAARGSPGLVLACAPLLGTR